MTRNPRFLVTINIRPLEHTVLFKLPPASA
jgi:hypothetical protein